MGQRRTILLDVDHVVCFSGFLPAVNAFLGTNYEIDDFTDYYVDEAAIPRERFDEFIKFLNKRNIYDDASMLPGAVETIEKLNEEYSIFICSSCLNPFDLEGSGRLFKDKYDFLREHLPFIDPENYIFTNAKHIIKADIQIDDRLSNLDNDIEIRILFPSYHNKDITDEELSKMGVIRAGNDWRNGWEEISKILLKKENNIKKYELKK